MRFAPTRPLEVCSAMVGADLPLLWPRLPPPVPQPFTRTPPPLPAQAMRSEPPIRIYPRPRERKGPPPVRGEGRSMMCGHRQSCSPKPAGTGQLMLRQATAAHDRRTSGSEEAAAPRAAPCTTALSCAICATGGCSSKTRKSPISSATHREVVRMGRSRPNVLAKRANGSSCGLLHMGECACQIPPSRPRPFRSPVTERLTTAYARDAGCRPAARRAGSGRRLHSSSGDFANKGDSARDDGDRVLAALPAEERGSGSRASMRDFEGAKSGRGAAVGKPKGQAVRANMLVVRRCQRAPSARSSTDSLKPAAFSFTNPGAQTLSDQKCFRLCPFVPASAFGSCPQIHIFEMRSRICAPKVPTFGFLSLLLARRLVALNTPLPAERIQSFASPTSLPILPLASKDFLP